MRGGAGASRAIIIVHDVVLHFSIAMAIVTFIKMVAMLMI